MPYSSLARHYPIPGFASMIRNELKSVLTPCFVRRSTMKVKWFDVVETAVRTISKIGVKIFLPRWILKPSFHSLKNERCFSNANRHPHAMGTIFRMGLALPKSCLRLMLQCPISRIFGIVSKYLKRFDAHLQYNVRPALIRAGQQGNLLSSAKEYLTPILDDGNIQ